MAKAVIRFGKGLNFRSSEDVVQEGQLLSTDSIRFDEDGAIQIEKPQLTLQASLLSCSTVLLGDAMEAVHGIVDMLFDGARRIFLKNGAEWQRVGYDGSSPTHVFCDDYGGSGGGEALVEGANQITFVSEAAQNFVAPAAGTVVAKIWGAGGGGIASSGAGTGNGGGCGGYSTSTFTVVGGDQFSCYVGEGGEGGAIGAEAQGGWPDGGNGKINSGGIRGFGGGGGSTRVYWNSVLALVAGGGGGGGLGGGPGGGTSGQDDASSPPTQVTGGTQVAGGVDLSDPGDTVKHGSSFQGGAGGTNNTTDAGGGGGGGYFGGGGGGGNGASSRGGGGGSGHLAGLGASESTSTSTIGTESPPPNSGDAAYSASAGRYIDAVKGNTDTACGGIISNAGNATKARNGGYGLIVLTFTQTGAAGGYTEATDNPFNDWEHPLTGLVYRGTAYLTDGYYFRRIRSGVTTQRVGVQVPTAPTTPTEGAAASGASVAGATYKWRYSFWNGVAESNLSPPLTYTAVNSGRDITITIAIDSQTDTGTIARRIYRSDQNGEVVYFVGEVANNSATTYTDVIGLPYKADPDAVAGDDPETTPPDVYKPWKLRRKWQSTNVDTLYEQDAVNRAEVIQTNLGILADWTDHDQPFTDQTGTVRNIMLLDDVVYGIVENDTLAFSALGNPEYWSPYNRVFIGRQNGETLLDIKPMDKDVFCYTDLGVWRFRRLGVNATESLLEHVPSQSGAVSESGVVVTENQGHIIFGRDGIYQNSGQRILKISQTIEDLWRDSSNVYYADPDKMLSVVGMADGDKVWFSYRTSNSTSWNDAVLHIDMTDGTPKFSTASWGATSLHRGYDHTLFGGNENDDLFQIDPPTWSGTVTGGFRTQLIPMDPRALPEGIILDMDLNGRAATIGIYGDSYDNLIATWTISTARSFNGRAEYLKKIPVKGNWSRLGLSVTVIANGTRAPKFYEMRPFIDPGESTP